MSTSTDERMEEEPVHENKNEAFVYLPASFTGGPRYFSEKYLNGLNAASKLGGATYFITMTTNPFWREIREQLKPYESAVDRPDIVACVFKMKYAQLLEDLTKSHVMGFVRGYLAVTEFQKRGLPHGHILLIIDQLDRPKNANAVDFAVSAEIPDKLSNPILHKIVVKNMLHGPCTKQCLDTNGHCKKRFPYEFLESTQWQGDSQIRYKRPKNGLSIEKHGHIFTNQHVVPYNPWLLLKYNCHVNVLICTTKIASIKYLFKYLTKGVDMATMRCVFNESHDEIELYLNGRYMSAPEAIWKIFSFGILEISPATLRFNLMSSLFVKWWLGIIYPH
jgi:hypothetical protein